MIITDTAELRKENASVSLQEAQTTLVQLQAAFLEQQPALGLAAPQIGIHQRVAIARISREVMPLINPRILERGGSWTSFQEGCLSFPGLRVDVRRCEYLIFETDTLEGDRRRFYVNEIEAAVIEHEIEHLEGILLVDKQRVGRSPVVRGVKVGRNDPCPCGSGKKYKKCCALVQIGK